METRTLNDFDDGLQLLIKNHLPRNDKKALCQSNHRFYSLFKQECVLDDLLQHLTNCEFEKIQKRFLEQPEVLLQRLNITDSSLRIFKNISIFEFLLLMLDLRPIALKAVRSLPRDHNNNLRKGMLEQLQTLKSKPATYNNLRKETHTAKLCSTAEFSTHLKESAQIIKTSHNFNSLAKNPHFANYFWPLTTTRPPLYARDINTSTDNLDFTEIPDIENALTLKNRPSSCVIS